MNKTLDRISMNNKENHQNEEEKTITQNEEVYIWLNHVISIS